MKNVRLNTPLIQPNINPEWINSPYKLNVVLILEDRFRGIQVPSIEKMTRLAKHLNLTPQQVICWFQDRLEKEKFRSRR